MRRRQGLEPVDYQREEIKPALERTLVLVFGAISTASSGLTLARQLGGDAPLMSTIIAVQTAAVFLTLPLSIILVQSLLDLYGA